MSSYITRNLQENCVMARVQRQKKRVQQNFSLKEYSSWEAAETAAEKWIASLLPTLPEKISSKDRMTRRNHSGVVGVYYAPGKRRLKSGAISDYPGYVAQIPGHPGGIRWMLSSCNGDDMAFIHAYICRKLEIADRQVVEEAVRKLSRAERTQILTKKKLGG